MDCDILVYWTSCGVSRVGSCDHVVPETAREDQATGNAHLCCFICCLLPAIDSTVDDGVFSIDWRTICTTVDVHTSLTHLSTQK